MTAPAIMPDPPQRAIIWQIGGENTERKIHGNFLSFPINEVIYIYMTLALEV